MILRQLVATACGLLLVLATSCQTSSARVSSSAPLDGGWEFVPGRYTSANGTVTEFSNSFVRAGNGQYTVAGSTYT